MIPTGEWTRNETKRNETERNEIPDNPSRTVRCPNVFSERETLKRAVTRAPLCNWLQTASDEGLSHDVTFCRQSKGEGKERWIDGGGGGRGEEVERGMTGENSGALGEG